MAAPPARIQPSLSAENLADDPLLVKLPRDTEGRPLLAGFPLICTLLKGGMEAIYYSIDPGNDSEVALRILPLSIAERDPALPDRLASEARTARALWSPHVVRVLDEGRDQGLHYVVSEYVPGESVGITMRRLMTRGVSRLPEEQAVLYAASAARGLADAHAAGLLHRDIRPDNLIVQRGGKPPVKLAGLGHAKPEGEGFRVGRQVHFAMGMPGFLAPEQARDWRAAGPAADVFALGATLYAMLAGYPPFTGNSIDAILRDTRDREPDVLPDVSDGVARILTTCLEKLPAKRYADGARLFESLRAVAPGIVEQALEVDETLNLEPAGSFSSPQPPPIIVTPPPETPPEEQTLQPLLERLDLETEAPAVQPTLPPVPVALPPPRPPSRPPPPPPPQPTPRMAPLPVELPREEPTPEEPPPELRVPAPAPDPVSELERYLPVEPAPAPVPEYAAPSFESERPRQEAYLPPPPALEPPPPPIAGIFHDDGEVPAPPPVPMQLNDSRTRHKYMMARHARIRRLILSTIAIGIVALCAAVIFAALR